MNTPNRIFKSNLCKHFPNEGFVDGCLLLSVLLDQLTQVSTRAILHDYVQPSTGLLYDTIVISAYRQIYIYIYIYLYLEIIIEGKRGRRDEYNTCICNKLLNNNYLCVYKYLMINGLFSSLRILTSDTSWAFSFSDIGPKLIS